MKITKTILAMFLIVVCAVTSYSLEKIYVYPSKAKNTSKDEVTLIANYFVDLLSKRKKFKIKTSIEDATSIVTPGLKEALKVGKKKKVDYVLLVWLSKISGTYVTNIKFIDVKKKTVVFSTTKNAKNLLDFERISNDVVNEMFGANARKSNKKRKYQHKKRVQMPRGTTKSNIFIFSGIKAGVTLPIDSKLSEELSFDFPHLNGFVRLQNLIIPNSVLDIEVGYFSLKGDNGYEYDIKSTTTALLVGYNIVITKELFLVPKLGCGYWMQSGSERDDGKKSSFNYPTANTSVELGYNIIKDFSLSIDYRIISVFSSGYTYVYHSPVVGLSYMF